MAVVGRASNDYCADCKKFFTDFKEMITDKTEQVRFLIVHSVAPQAQFCISRMVHGSSNLHF